MKKFKSAILLAGVILAFVAVQQVESKRHSPQAEAVANFAFGLRTAGTWIGEYVAYLPEPTDPIPLLQSLSADGTLIITSPELHGNGSPEFSGLRTPFHGTWARSGLRQVKWAGAMFALDQYGALGAPVFGGIGAIVKMSGASNFDKDYQTFTGAATAEVFMENQDPLDPDQEPIASFPITYTFRKMNVE